MKINPPCVSPIRGMCVVACHGDYDAAYITRSESSLSLVDVRYLLVDLIQESD